MYQNYLENSIIHKAKGTCDFETAKIKRLLRTFNDMGLYQTSEIDKNALNRLILGLKQDCGNKTINKMLLITRQAYKFNNIEFEYLQSFKKLKEEKRSFAVIPESDLKLIMNQVFNYDSEVGNNLLYQTIICLMLETGIRSNEIINIEIKNIDSHKKRILLTETKTKTDRVIFYTSMSARFVDKMMQAGPKRNYLLYNFLKKRESAYKDIKYLIDKLKKELGITNLHPHMFRHTFATLGYNRGMDLNTLRVILGHENIATTLIYARLSEEKLRQAYDNGFLPIAREFEKGNNTFE